jgi:copper chaperone NosL
MGYENWLGRSPERVRAGLLVAAAALVGASIFLPLWGMTLVSVQYPEGLRMVVYPNHISGDVTELNLLNHYIGMAEISNDYFAELRIIPVLFAVIAIAALTAALVRRPWCTAAPLVAMTGAAAYGFWSMHHRLYQFGHELDPAAAIDIEPFTPPMIGEHTLAQFATYSYFSWGTFLPMVAGALVALALWIDLRGRLASRTRTGSPRTRSTRSHMTWKSAALLLAMGVMLSGCAKNEEGATEEAAAAEAPAAPSAGDEEYARLTASWSPEAVEACGRTLRETLGTRDLVQGALDGVKDPEGKAAAELEDARSWKRQGDAKVDSIRPQLEAGACDEGIPLALDEAVQFYVKAGTSAVQAGQIAGS